MRLFATALATTMMTMTVAHAAPVDDFLKTLPYVPASAAEVDTRCASGLALGATLRRQLESAPVGKTADNLRVYDDLTLVLSGTINDASLIGQVAPDDPRRNAARTCEAKAKDAYDAVGMSRAVYDRLAAIDAAKLDPAGQLVLKRTLAEFDRNGVSKDEATRAKIAALKVRLNELDVAFGKNIADGRLTVTADPAELDGLPADWIAARKPGADGKITISTDTPDYVPVMTYAKNEALRKRLYFVYQNRAPGNDPVLRELITKRDELARLLGRPNFATLALEDKMTGSPARANAFLVDISAAADASAKRDLAKVVARYAALNPGATTIPAWSSGYVSQLIRKESYAVDPQEVRQYFDYAKVRDGILQWTRDLFGVEIRPWNTPKWDASVETYEMLEGGKVIGRFYFDNHPRPGKYNHANVHLLRAGLENGRAIPVSAMVSNFPTGLMEHRDVETFLHEYGHLIHVLFAGNLKYANSSMGNLEWDFIEAPSTMLENWVWDYDTLSRFATNAAGQPISRDLVAKMNRARYFGEALGDRRQLALSNISLGLYGGPPPADLTAEVRKLDSQYALISLPEGTAFQNAFGHLTGYSAFYYTYMWSKSISTDLFTRFEREGLRSPATAAAYRNAVLAQGGKKPAATLVQDFLGRPLSLDAYKARLAKGE